MLIPRAGSITQPSSQTNPQTSVDVTDVLNQQPFIKNVQLNRTAFNPTTYSEEFQLLQGYLEGARVNVTYFNRLPIEDDRRTDAIDISSVRNSINQRYVCINNFEITLVDGLQTTYNEDETESTVSGEAILYPGLNPNIGDAFVFQLTNGQFGLCSVNSVQRLSIRQGTNHKITFTVREFATTPDVQLLIDAAVSNVFFDKITYLSSTSTLLQQDMYTYLQTMRQMRIILVKYYYKTFYNRSAAAILSPDGFYDAYMNKFLNSKVSTADTVVRSTQYPIDDLEFNTSLWGRLLDIYNTSIADLLTTYQTIQRMKHYTDTLITGLLNKFFVILDQGSTAAAVATNPSMYTDSSYVLSQAFYNGTTVGSGAMSAFEMIVYNAIQNKQIADIAGLINNYLNQYQTLSPQQQYYYIPLYIFLIDMGINTVTMQTAGTDLLITAST